MACTKRVIIIVINTADEITSYPCTFVDTIIPESDAGSVEATVAPSNKLGSSGSLSI